MSVPRYSGVQTGGAEKVIFDAGDGARDVSALEVLRRLIMGFRTTQLVYVAAKLGIADLLENGPQGTLALASALGAQPLALYRLLRALASLGIFAETADGSFELTPLARTLQRDVPGSLRDMALLYGDEWLWQAYGRAEYSVMTGLPAFDHVHDRPFYAYLRDHTEAAATFDRAMSAFSRQEAAAILGAYDFSAASTIVDVGGGQGALLAVILSAHPRARGILLDQDDVIARARAALADVDGAERCTMATGDFFAAVPEGGDIYMLKSVLHNWDDARSIAILERCRGAMRGDAKLLVIERIVAEGNEYSEAKLFDINHAGRRRRARAHESGVRQLVRGSRVRSRPSRSDRGGRQHHGRRAAVAGGIDARGPWSWRVATRDG